MISAVIAVDGQTHELWDLVGAALRSSLSPTRKADMPDPTAYTHDQIAAALNRAVEDITYAASLPEEGTIDALNLLVNAATHYLEHSDDGLAEVVEAGYDATLDEVLGWILS